MKNKKGFTLVELIAVIVLLALIALLITPKISETLKKQKLEIFRDSVEGIVDTVKKDAVSNAGISTGMSSYRSYTFNENSLQLDAADYESPDEKIMLSGSIENGTGNIIITNVSDISLAITNGKYCATKTATERDITVVEMQDGDTCGMIDTTIESAPSCFTYNENPDGTLTITGYDFANTKYCGPSISIPNKINKKVVSAIEEGAFFDYNEERYILVANYMYYVKDDSGNIIDEYWISDYPELLPVDAEINYYYFTRVTSANEKYCYNISDGTSTEVDLNYQKTASDGYDYCSIDADYYKLVNDNVITGIDLSKNYNIKEIPELLAPGSRITTINLGTNVTNIGISAFESNIITNLQIPNKLVDIASSAFSDNDIKSIDFSNASNLANIGTTAFYYNNIESLDLTGAVNLKNIGANAFEDNLIYTVVFNENLEAISDGAFYENYIINVSFDNLANLKYVGNYAFEYNSVSTLSFENTNNLEYIGNYAFYYNNIKNLDLSGLTKLSYIGKKSFYENNISALDLTGLTNLEYIGDYAFAYNYTSGEINLLDSTNLAYIGYRAFRTYSGSPYTNIYLPAYISELGEQAFYGTSSCDGYNFYISLDSDVTYNTMLSMDEYTYQDSDTYYKFRSNRAIC